MITYVLMACIILHNMVIENEEDLVLKPMVELSNNTFNEEMIDLCRIC